MLSPLTAPVTSALIDCYESRPLWEYCRYQRQLMWDLHKIINLLCVMMVFSPPRAEQPLWLSTNCGLLQIKRCSRFWIYHTANPPSLVKGTQQVVASNSVGPPKLITLHFSMVGCPDAETLSSCSRHLTTATFIYWLHFAYGAAFTAPLSDTELM